MTEAFETDRLRVYEFTGQPGDPRINRPRSIYVAMRIDEDRPMVCATAVVFNETAARKAFGGPYIDWLEVCSEYRRRGFASEFLRGLNKHLKCECQFSAGSIDGEAFCAAWDEKHPAKEPA